MPREIVTTDGRSFSFRDVELPPLGSQQLRVRVRFAAPKHGTEMHLYGGSSFDRKRWDSRLRMFLPRPADEEARSRPDMRSVGNMYVGEVVEAGPEAQRFALGEMVFGYGPIREVNQASQDDLWPLGTLTPEDAVCVDPAHVAFVAVRDGNIRIGDDVAVYGLGAIGLMTVRIARAAGARRVFAVDPAAVRRASALRGGADAAYDPAACDAALEIKRAADDCGVDVAIETSGSAAALHDSIRCIRQCGVIVHVPWGPRSCADLHLDEEFHLNRPTIVASQAWAGWGNPDRSYPLWTHERAFEATIELFRSGLVTARDLIEPHIAFEDAPAEMARLMASPDHAVKVGVVFPG